MLNKSRQLTGMNKHPIPSQMNHHLQVQVKVQTNDQAAATWTTAVTQLSDTKDNAPDKTTPEATHATETRLHIIKLERSDEPTNATNSNVQLQYNKATVQLQHR